MKLCETPVSQSRDSIKDIWGKRDPYKHEWPVRVDYALDEEPDSWVTSACVLCSNGCGLDIGVKNGKVVGVRGRATDRVNKGRLGPKGLHGWKAINHEDRLKYPMIRRNGRLEQASWDDALDLMVEKSKDIMERLTSHGIAFYTTGQFFLEEYYALALIGKGGLHTLHMDGNTRLCTATAAASMRESFGSDGQPGSYTDIDYTDCIFMVGHNMAATQTVLWSRILDRLDGPDPPKLIVVDPRRSESAERATIHLAPKIGTNLALLNGIQHLMLKNGWFNKEYLDKHVVGLEALAKTVSEFPPNVVETITGIPAAQLEKAARILGTTSSLLSTALQGVYQSNQATASACQINNINLLRGLIGKAGSGILQMNGQPTAQNNRETGCDGEFPGFRNHLNRDHMQELADIWNIDYIKCPHWNEPTHVENLLNYISNGTIEMLWVSGTNPLVSLPNLARVRDLLTNENLFLVVQDIYMTETAAIADVVLPAAQWGEKTGCFTNVDRTVHLSHKAVDPPGEAKSDLDIFLMYARRMGFKDKDGNDLLPWKSPEEVFNAWKKLSKGRPCDYSAMTYDKLTGGSGIQWPCNEEHPYGKERLFDNAQFFTDIDYCESFGHDLETGTPYSRDEYKAMNPRGRAILKACHYAPPLEEADEEYPFTLSTGRRAHHFHTRTKTGRTQLQKACSLPEIVLSESDAASLDVRDGDEVIVESRRGQVQLPIKIGSIEKGQTFMPFHFGYFDSMGSKARAANELTLSTWDPISKQPMFKSGAVKIRKVLTPVEGEVAIHIREKQTSAEERASRKSNILKDHSPRQRQLERWLGEFWETIDKLVKIYSRLVPKLVDDSEIQGGLRIMRRIAIRMRDRISPIVKKYHEDKEWGQRRAHMLAELLFPEDEKLPGSYKALETLQGLHTYLGHIRGALTGMTPVSQALWDLDCVRCVEECLGDLRRMEAWVLHQMTVKAPQSLLVPTILP